MSANAVHVEQILRENKVQTAVNFLRQVHWSNLSDDGRLRRYLLTKHGLSKAEVVEAFRLHKNYIDQDAVTQDGKTENGQEDEMKIRKDHNRPKGNSEGTVGNRNSMSFLLKEWRAEGQKLLFEFLQKELNYCKVLECLCHEYYKTLIKKSEDREFNMTHQEVEEIFGQVPSLLKFHQNEFYAHLIKGKNISKTFLRCLQIFGGYAEYMKECILTVRKMRKYIWDTKLHNCLEDIKRDSKRSNDDMIDLLLVPLDRMSDYRKFLDKLCEWADQTQTETYELISKATRRFRRLVSYIQKQKVSILNRSEMNKVQWFLNKQCNILSPNRRIVRRGVMIRQTTGWSAKIKQYIFFLFNDILLWTGKTGVLKNVVTLRDCEVMETESDQHRSRKLKVVSDGRKKMVLHLECATERQRNDWFVAIHISINREKAAMTNSSDRPNEVEQPGVEFSTSIQLEKKSTERSDTSSNQISGIRQIEYVSFTSLGQTNSENLHHDDQYEYSRNFPNEDLIEFEPFDDSVSVSVSEFSTQDSRTVESPNDFVNQFQTNNLNIQRYGSTRSSRLMRVTEEEKKKVEDDNDFCNVSAPLDRQPEKKYYPSEESKSIITRRKSQVKKGKQREPTTTTKLVNTISLSDVV